MKLQTRRDVESRGKVRCLSWLADEVEKPIVLLRDVENAKRARGELVCLRPGWDRRVLAIVVGPCVSVCIALRGKLGPYRP
jgi:hypothetical protein